MKFAYHVTWSAVQLLAFCSSIRFQRRRKITPPASRAIPYRQLAIMAAQSEWSGFGRDLRGFIARKLQFQKLGAGIPATLLVALLFGGQTASSHADDVKDSDGKSLSLVAEHPKFSNQEFEINYSYVGDAKLGGKNRGNDGDLGEQTTSLRHGVKFPLNDQLSLRLGIDYNRFDFSRPSGSFLPQNLQQFSAGVGLSYVVSEEWIVFANFGPTLSLINGFDIYSDNITFGGVVGASYIANKDLSFQFGLAVSPDNGLDIPVLPFGSLQWNFAENWKLNLGLPKTSIDWNIQPNLRLSLIEAQFVGGTFHTNGDYGTKTGNPDLNNRRLDYQEVRIGSRVSYSVTPNIELDLAVGIAAYRNFDFEDASNASPTVDPAPYFQVGTKISF